jgi:dTDP-L-rhamnose 4-epimerase
VRVLDALAPPVHLDGRVPDYLSPEVEFIHGDVRDRKTMRRALEGVDVVLHLAAYQDYLTDFSRFFDVNATGTALLYELIVNDRLPVQKVVVASSQSVYGEGKYRCAVDGVVYPILAARSAAQGPPVGSALSRHCGGPLQVETSDEAQVRPPQPVCHVQIRPGDDRAQPGPALRHPHRGHALLHHPGAAPELPQRLLRHLPHLRHPHAGCPAA